MKRIIVIIGTRPDAIKLAPIIKELQKYPTDFTMKVLATAQHRKMLDQVVDIFNIDINYDLNIMIENQDIFGITINTLNKIKVLLSQEKIDFIMIQGDTTTAFAASLGAFYLKIPILHIEAGLRTNNKYSPFPEEINRKLISHLSDLHFAPSQKAEKNLIKEGVDSGKIYMVGNTVIDSLFYILDNRPKYNSILTKELQNYINGKGVYILVTAHRRENFGAPLEDICKALREIASKNKLINIIYPLHPNPNVFKPVKELLVGIDNILLISPLPYHDFVWLMKNSYFILTDSGGIQEEAAYLGKPVLVLREITERPEVVEEGSVKVIGTKKTEIVRNVYNLLNNITQYEKMSKFSEPYGDGKAALRIVDILRKI